MQREVGQPPLSDQALTLLGSGTVRHAWVLDEDERLLAYGQRAGEVVEIAGDAALVLAELGGDDEVLVWSHGRRSPLEPLLRNAGFEAVRTLHQMRRPLDEPVAALPAPTGVIIRPFVPGRDEDAFLRVNADAFADHPEQGSWVRADIEARAAEPWFDEKGLLLADRAGQLLGFHFTKVHKGGAGEVYVIGVDRTAQGLGLGKVLLAAGLQHLQQRGCSFVLLYVEDTNIGARQMYVTAGFTDFDRDVQWRGRL